MARWADINKGSKEFLISYRIIGCDLYQETVRAETAEEAIQKLRNSVDSELGMMNETEPDSHAYSEGFEAEEIEGD